jgi:hypothetical protein
LLTLDHVGALVRDLGAGAARWERLGFTLSPVSPQRGAVPGRDGMHPWASANRCAIFERGYLELIGLVNPSAYNPWQHFLERREGLHLLALRCQNADEAYAGLRAAAPFLQPPVQRERQIVGPGSERTLRFRNVFSSDALCPEGRYIIIEHQTPELLWQPELMRHANGAVGLEEVFVVADDQGVAERVAALGGIACVLSSAAFEVRFGWSPPAPGFAGVTVSFAALDETARIMQTRGLALRERKGDVWIAPEDANGFVLRLTQDDQPRA